ncbi:MAG: hypothetical protein V9H26_06335 [Verrucomicrobiota bacterium]|nr:hypothetical protein [Verrucomicrobiota bacterium]MCC6819665.1 hypothetical protein [Limisphaerales bacterium]
MSKDTTKPKAKTKVNTELQLLELLKQVLPKATHDSKLAGKIYEAVEAELKAKSRVAAFEKFCERVELPDLEAKTLEDVKLQLAAAFGAGGDVVIQPDRKEKSLAVEITLPDGTQFQNQIKVRPITAAESDEPEVKLKFVPFPVALPGDPELVWVLGKREDLSAEEAAIALGKAEEDFWGSKAGQKFLRDRVERSFPEFIIRAPAGLLGEAGVKRHYPTPEPIKVLRVLKPQKGSAHRP